MSMVSLQRYNPLFRGLLAVDLTADGRESVTRLVGLLCDVVYQVEAVSPEGTFCDTVQIPSSVGDMELI